MKQEVRVKNLTKKTFLVIFMAMLSLNSSHGLDIVNIADEGDKNTVPAELEKRKYPEGSDYRNLPDNIDKNIVPGPLEERQKEEESDPYRETLEEQHLLN
jgi:hypothetical protein